MLKSYLRPGRFALLALTAVVCTSTVAATRNDEGELQDNASPLRFEIVYPAALDAGPPLAGRCTAGETGGAAGRAARRTAG